jgi:uncharacterized protein (DUF488 family)
MTGVVHAIGHSNHSIERFLTLLEEHQITAIADVRSRPYSKLYPHFSREPLALALKDRGISYVFLGRELGARSEDPAAYAEGRVQYRRLAETELFKEGIQRIQRGLADNRIAILCAEREPLDCHRTILVARELEAIGVEVVHILANGKTERHEDTVARLVASFGWSQADLLRSSEQVVDDAYAKQEQRIAFTQPDAEVDRSAATS